MAILPCHEYARPAGGPLYDREQLQQQLNDFYTAILARERSLFDESHLRELSAPLLIAVSDAYLAAPVRIMFVGKETNGWWGRLGKFYATDDAVASLLARYRTQMTKGRWKGRFFRMLARVAHEAAGASADAVAWTNLLKTDWDHGRGYSRTAKGVSAALTRMSQEMLRFEVSVLQPHVIVFACGSTYDSLIRNTFPERSHSEAIVRRALWQFRIGDIQCYRCQHPQTIARAGSRFKPVDFYYEDVIARIRARHPASAPASGAEHFQHTG